MKKDYEIYIVMALIIVIPLIIFFITFSINNKVTILELNTYKSMRGNDECIFIEVNHESAKKFSFDGGKTWQEQNEKFICMFKENKIHVKARNERDKLIAEKILDISKIKDDRKIEYKRINEKNEKISCSKHKTLIGFDYTVGINSPKENFKIIDFKACDNCLSEKLLVVNCEKVKKDLFVEVDNLKNTVNVLIGENKLNSNTPELTYKYDSINCKKDDIISDLITRTNMDINKLNFITDNFLVANTSIQSNRLSIKCNNIGKTKLHIIYQDKVLKTIEISVQN